MKTFTIRIFIALTECSHNLKFLDFDENFDHWFKKVSNDKNSRSELNLKLKAK